MGLLMGCNNGMAELEKRNSFYDSVVKIGQGFQEIFGIFGNAIGDVLGGGTLGFDAVKSSDTRDKVGEHLKKVKQGLEETKNKLKELSGKMSQAKNADTKGVETVISSASEVIGKLIEHVNNLAGVTAKGGTTNIDDAADNATAVVSAKEDVQTVINSVKEIIKAAEDSGLKIAKIAEGKDGGPVTAANGGDVVAKSGSGATANMGPKLADEVAKADPWAMINKIKDAKTASSGTSLNDSNNNDAGELATGIHATNAGAKTNADLAAAVALKAMTKGGKFSVNSVSNEGGAVKAAAANAVNKVLGVLDEIISRTVASELSKVGKAVNGVQYSENTAEKNEGSTTK